MNSPKIFALSVAVACLATAAVARAGFPPPQNSTIPAFVRLVGRDPAGQADPLGRATVILRDLANNPIPGMAVLIDFSVTPDMRPTATQPDPAIVAVNCAGGAALTVITGADGSATFSIVGQAIRDAASGAHLPTLRFYAGGEYLGASLVSAYDLNGGGVGATDLNAWLQDFFSDQYWARADYDGDGGIHPNDLSEWLKAYFASNSVQGGMGGTCP